MSSSSRQPKHLQQHNLTTSSTGLSSAVHVLLLLVALRVVNALVVKTFYVPDEYYQSLEPAWQLAFGSNSGAWITWVGEEPPMPP